MHLIKRFVLVLPLLAVLSVTGHPAAAKNCETCPIPCNVSGCRG